MPKLMDKKIFTVLCLKFLFRLTYVYIGAYLVIKRNDLSLFIPQNLEDLLRDKEREKKVSDRV